MKWFASLVVFLALAGSDVSPRCNVSTKEWEEALAVSGLIFEME